ncbi:MAG TPA: divergent polysaccharide deacetylase family protein [Stellaceae bacterium]
MDSPRVIVPDVAPSTETVVDARAGDMAAAAPRHRLADLLTRRWLLLVAGGGFAAGLTARQVLRDWAPAADGAPDQAAGLVAHPAGSALPMEEEPLPHEVRLPVARPSVPAPPAIHEAAAAEPDPLIAWAPRPVSPAVSLVVVAPPVAQSIIAKPVIAPAAPVETMRPPATLSAGEAAWLRNARPFIDTRGAPTVAIVIDDLGLSAVHTRQAIALPDSVTLALMTYAPRLEDWAASARAARHELLVHVPMQPLNGKIDPGPNALTVALSDADILSRLRWGLVRMDGYVGINNHMGSRFTQDRAGMSVVMAEVKARGLLFLDSVTIGHTVGAATAEPLHVPFAERNVFLDDQPTVAGVSHQIAVLEQVARRHGAAIAIGHPHPATLAVLAQWLPRAAARGIAVVPLTSLMRRHAARV